VTPAEVLAESAARDWWSEQVTVMQRLGYAAGEAAHADDYARGYAAGVADIKRTLHQAVEVLRVYLARGGGPRMDFGQLRPDTRPVRGKLPAEYPIKPKTGGDHT
jgi:hypothetical protein